ARVKIEEGVGVVVITDPTGGGDVVIEPGLSAVEDFPLDLTQFDFDAESIAPHLLQLHGDLALHLSCAPSSGAKCVLHPRKASAFGKVGFGQKFGSLCRIEGKAKRGLVVRDAIRDEMPRGFFSAMSQFSDNSFFVSCEGKGFANEGVIERFSSDVEAV